MKAWVVGIAGVVLGFTGAALCYWILFVILG